MTNENRRLDELRRSLVSAHQSEQRRPEKKAAGLQAILDAEARSAAPQARGRSKALIGGGLIVLTIVGAGGAWYLTQREPPATPSPAVALTQPPATELPTPPPRPEEQELVGPAPPTIVEPVPRPAVDSSKRIAPATRDDPDLLAKELALIDVARSQRKDDPEGALKTLDQHTSEFPRGSLKQEASLIRVEVLVMLGRRNEAEALAKRLMAADRGGLLRKRLERLLAPP